TLYRALFPSPVDPSRLPSPRWCPPRLLFPSAHVIPPPPRSTLFPYTTLFRSNRRVLKVGKARAVSFVGGWQKQVPQPLCFGFFFQFFHHRRRTPRILRQLLHVFRYTRFYFFFNEQFRLLNEALHTFGILEIHCSTPYLKNNNYFHSSSYR